MRNQSTVFRELTASELALWTDLLGQESRSCSPFLTHEFCSAVDQTRGNVFVASLGTGGNRAFLPFRRRIYAPSIADKVGGHMSDICGIIGNQGYRAGEILSAARLSVLCFDHWVQPGCPVPADSVVESYGTKVNFDSAETYFSNLRRLDRKFVNEVHRLEEQLSEQCGALRFEWQSSNPQMELERLVAEKRRQYAQTNADDALSSDWSRALLNRLLTTRSAEFETVMSTMYCGDHWIASHFGLRYRNVLHIWFPVYNNDFRRFGPGHILLFKTFSQASTLGVTEFDFGAGVSSYKKKYRGTNYSLAKGSLKSANLTALGHTVAQSVRWKIQRYRRQQKLV